MRSALPVIMTCLCLLVITLPALADDDNILAQLGHQKFTIRQQATYNLLANPQLDDPTIDRLFACAVTAEQHHRLLDVARHHMLRRIRKKKFNPGNRGSLGVIIQHVDARQLPEYKHGAIYIGRAFPGFPAYWRLERGDMILAINDKRPTDLDGTEITQFLQKQITGMPPGTPVQLTVLRDSRTINITVNLASMQALNAMYAQMPGINSRSSLPLTADLQTAWQKRRQHLLNLLPPT